MGTWLAHPVPGRWIRSEHVEFDAEHLIERCRLFLIIALGETVLTAGGAIAPAPIDTMTLVTGTSAMGITVSLVAGLIAVAVANELVIAHPQGPGSAALTILLFGGAVHRAPGCRHLSCGTRDLRIQGNEG